MPKKLSFYTIKKSFEDSGYILLSKDCENARIKLKYKCPNDHINSMSWSNWKNGRRCPTCFNLRRHDINKLNHNDVKNAFINEGFILLSRYKNAHQKLDYICPNGHRHSIKWNHWKSGHRCPYCSKNALVSFDKLKASIKKENVTLLSYKLEIGATKYRLKCLCSNGHIFYTTKHRWLHGQRCPRCHNVKYSKENHWNWKGGITPYNRKIRQNFEYKSWRRNVYKRDKHTCQMCGQIGGDLEAHHIFKFHNYKFRRHNIWNGITLCKKCHRSIKTKEDNYTEQFLNLNMDKYEYGSNCYRK